VNHEFICSEVKKSYVAVITPARWPKHTEKRILLFKHSRRQKKEQKEKILHHVRERKKKKNALGLCRRESWKIPLPAPAFVSHNETTQHTQSDPHQHGIF
jgi:hypothetical protein